MKKFLALLLISALCVCTFGNACAFAEADAITFTAGEPIEYYRNVEYGKSISSCSVEGAVSVSNGDSLAVNWSASQYYRISGKVNTAGTYSFTVVINWTDGTQSRDEYKLTIVEPKKLELTKNPTGEVVLDGSYALFVSRCENASEIIWHIYSPDGAQDYTGYEAEEYYSGLGLDGVDSDTLALYGVSLAMNGCRVQAEFRDGKGNSLFSEKALLTVEENTVKTPAITSNPGNATVREGVSVTLSVAAYSPDENKLSYQWYCSENETGKGGKAIDGATDPEYVITAGEPGTIMYFYCKVTNSDGYRNDASAKSSVAAVTVIVPPSPTPEPTTAPQAEKAEPSGESMPQKEDKPVTVTEVSHGTGSGARIAVFGVIILILIIGIIAVLIYIKKKLLDE